ncbi:MAG: LysM peptidoglycan-binding domain-containing protein, partial [Chloroflexota bacterium]
MNAKETAASTSGENSIRSSHTASRYVEKADRLILSGAWLFALSLVILAVYVGYRTRIQPGGAILQASTGGWGSGEAQAAINAASQPNNNSPLPLNLSGDGTGAKVEMPALVMGAPLSAVARTASLHTIFPTRPREEVITYTVDTGDSVFSIAKSYNIKPETVLWANYDQLNDSPDMLTPGMELRVPPADGVYYTWEEGDTLEGVASRFKAEPGDIVNWSGNRLDLASPQIIPGESILIPGGER